MRFVVVAYEGKITPENKDCEFTRVDVRENIQDFGIKEFLCGLTNFQGVQKALIWIEGDDCRIKTFSCSRHNCDDEECEIIFDRTENVIELEITGLEEAIYN